MLNGVADAVIASFLSHDKAAGDDEDEVVKPAVKRKAPSDARATKQAKLKFEA